MSRSYLRSRSRTDSARRIEPVTRPELYQMIFNLPPEKRERAAVLALHAYATGFDVGLSASRGARRDPEERRRYAEDDGDPWKYIVDVLRWKLTAQQERVLEELQRSDRVLNPSATNVGKTFLLAAYALYRFDAVAALPDEENDLSEQGCIVLLPGPDKDTVTNTIYKRMLMHAARAEAKGRLMPGVFRSSKIVNWLVRPDWMIEALTPPKRTGQEVAHTASGRHHRNMIAIVEEGQGVEEPLWLAVEGACTATGNKVFSNFNPTESSGPAYKRATSSLGYTVVHLSAMQHPNVLRRSEVVGGAISYLEVDKRVRLHCRDRGPATKVRANQKFNDFVYALGSERLAERGPRRDGVPGHPDARPHVFRPSGIFESQVLGRWPSHGQNSLFDPVALQESVERWKAGQDPDRCPDRVGADTAYTGHDEVRVAPAWGPDAATLVREFIEARDAGDEALEVLRRDRRIRVGVIRQVPNGDGPEVASAIVEAFPEANLYVVDLQPATVYDHMNRVMGVRVESVSFAAVAPPPASIEDFCENFRTLMYVCAALLVALGLSDAPDDPELLEELRACRVLRRSRVMAREGEEPRRVPTLLLIPKDEIKKAIGRSPDRADAWVLAQTDPLSDTSGAPGVY